MKFRTGWLPDVPDFRDRLYKDFFKIAAALPVPIRWLSRIFNWFKRYKPAVDLRSGMPPIFDQGNLGSCVENAWVAMAAFVENKEGHGPEILSRLFLYYNVRGGVPVDRGSMIRSAAKSLAKDGDCLETSWPYDISKWTVRPTTEAFAEASKRNAVGYYRLITLDDMLHCLDSGYPFVFGMSLYEQFETVGFTGKVALPKISDNYLGGHALCCVGYDRAEKLFLVRNSWGTGWGMGGYCWIPFQYLCSPTLADDFWTLRTIPA